MGNENKINCTVAILTFNSEKTLRRALESVKDFAEVIVCDGGSDDKTRDIARAYGARIIDQDWDFKDKEGRIINFAGVRNQTLNISKYDWFFYLDSDEELSEELINEIRQVTVLNKPLAYWVDRKYVLNNKVILCAATYPTRQMRFFHKSVVKEFIKPIHERIDPKPDALIRITKNYMLVPISSDPNVWRNKWKHYISLEVARRKQISFADWLLACAENLKVSALYLFRYGRNMIFCKGEKMPWDLEWERHVYHINLCKALLKIVKPI